MTNPQFFAIDELIIPSILIKPNTSQGGDGNTHNHMDIGP
jgi:hypothetical protein